MMLLPGKFAFIHIPKTGGTSVVAALRPVFPSAAVDDFERKHATAWDLAWHTPIACWEPSYKFAVVRNPWRLIESAYRFALGEARKLSWSANLPNADWGRAMQRSVGCASFGEYVRQEWLGPYSPLRPGGFWRTWCLGPMGENLGVEAFRFEELHQAWPGLCGKLGLADPPPLERLNASDPLALEWPPAERDAVGQLTWMDTETFGYSPSDA